MAVKVGNQYFVDQRHARLAAEHAKRKAALAGLMADAATAKGAAYQSAMAKYAKAKRDVQALWCVIADDYLSGHGKAKVDPTFVAKWRQENADLIK